MFVDTHCHLMALEHISPAQAVKNAHACGVEKLVCVGSVKGIQSAFDAVRIAEEHENVWATVGIHPHDAGVHTNVDEIAHLVSHPKVAAIGETGLDFFRDWSPHEAQVRLFRDTIELALTAGKPLVIHSRDALNETLQVLKSMNAARVGGVFHCYSGDALFAEKLREINFLVSFPGTLTFRKAEKLRQTAAAIPLDQILLETDCPYMAPEPYRGQPSEPAHVREIALRFAQLRAITLEQAAAATTANAERLFGLAAPGKI